MIYEIKNNIIYVTDKSQFNPKHILECGQVFRFGKNDNGDYFVLSKNHKATIIEQADCYEIHSDDAHYFVHYFDLNVDYNKAKQHLGQFEILKPMIEFGYGIRILNGDPEEMLYSYIISQNNNIKRIQKIIENLCQIGSKTNFDFNAFPTTDQINNTPFEFFQNIGAGYRDKFLKETARALEKVKFEELQQLSTNNLHNYLTSLSGIGPKVASCILLFGFSRKNKFPVDTWIEQVYYNHFSKKQLSRPAIQDYFESQFKEFSGIAQQYLFYYEREKNKG